MSNSNYGSFMEAPPGNQPLHSFSLFIPPPPLPPLFPPSNIPPPPVPPSFFPPSVSNSISQFPSQPFQSDNGMLVTPWSTSQLPPDHIFRQPFSVEEATVEKLSARSESQELVNSLLKDKEILEVHDKVSKKKNIQIYVVKERLNAAFKLVKELENDARTLSVMVKTVGMHEWDQKCEEIEEKKKELMMILNEVNLNTEDINLIKQKCSKRAKKRARLKRQAKQRQKQKEEDIVRNQNLNFQIDNWQKEMQEEVERAQREKELQREADAVLWGVTHKKSEARRQVALLSALLELRQVRVKRLTAAGKHVSQTQIDAFNTVIEQLKQMWKKHLDECLLEEQALKGMLSEAEVKEDPVKMHKKLVLQEWEMALFGSVGTLDSNPKGEELVNIRREWDKFAAQEHTVLATTIPPGWVLPVAPSSDQWRTVLKY